MKIFKDVPTILIITLVALFYNPTTSTGMLDNSADEIPITNTEQKQEAEEIPHCNQELLINYGLKGVGQPVITNHEFCPAIVQNCCTNDDEARSMEIWNADIKPIVER